MDKERETDVAWRGRMPGSGPVLPSTGATPDRGPTSEGSAEFWIGGLASRPLGKRGFFGKNGPVRSAQPTTVVSQTQKPSASTGTRLRVAAVQMVFAPSLEENLESIARAMDEVAAAGVDVVLFPECATTGYAGSFANLDCRVLKSALETLSTLAARHRIHLLVGSPVFRGRRLHNALLVFDRRGRLVHAYAKCQLTERDRRWFTPGDSLSLFPLEGGMATSILCHERRYPELVRIPVMAGARIVFHPNAGLDSRAVSRSKHGGRDGIAVRAFENAVFYVFANSVGPQGGGLWSAGDSKIVAPDGTVLGLADNCSGSVVVADLDLATATGRYAQESLQHPRFLAGHWRRILSDMRRRLRASDAAFRKVLTRDGTR